MNHPALITHQNDSTQPSFGAAGLAHRLRVATRSALALLLGCAWLTQTPSAAAATPGGVVAWGNNDCGQTTVPVAALSGGGGDCGGRVAHGGREEGRLGGATLLMSQKPLPSAPRPPREVLNKAMIPIVTPRFVGDSSRFCAAE
jgi:hypothetical protein